MIRWPWSKHPVKPNPIPLPIPTVAPTGITTLAITEETVVPVSVAVVETTSATQPSTSTTEINMSLLTTIETDALNVMKQAASLVTQAKTIWSTFSSTQNRNLALKLFADAVKLVSDGTAAASAGTLNLVLDEAVVADINTIINDAQAGNSVIKADLALLGIKL